MSASSIENNPAMDCPWCGVWGRLEMVQGHYECRNCKQTVMSCCDGDQADVYGDVPNVNGVDWDALTAKTGG